jgi:ribosomal protein S18 acetylase RimI-like enzyme
MSSNHVSHAGPAGDAGTDRVSEWLLDASNPYFEWLLGSRAVAERVLRRWTRRPSSEVSDARVTGLVLDGDEVGGFIAMAGADIRRCRSADAVALASSAEWHDDPLVAARLKESRALFSLPPPEDCYVSRLGVARHMRGRRLGSPLLELCLDRMRTAGFERIRLDVSATNESALALYGTHGFVRDDARNAGPLTYLALVRRL